MTMIDSPLLRTARLGPTDYWNDSCASDELAYAIERGADRRHLQPDDRPRGPRQGALALGAARPRAGGGQPVLDRGRADLGPRRGDGRPRRGRPRADPRAGARAEGPGTRSRPTRPTTGTPARMVEQAERFAGLAPNLQVKFPATRGRHRRHRGGDGARDQHQCHGLVHASRRPLDGGRGRRARPCAPGGSGRRSGPARARHHDHDRACRRLDAGRGRPRRPGRGPHGARLGRDRRVQARLCRVPGARLPQPAASPRRIATSCTGRSWSGAT